MSSLGRLISLVRQTPLSPGLPAPRYSLTADDGTWLRLEDFRENKHLVLIFCKSLNESTGAWLQGYDAARDQLEAVSAAAFATHTSAPPKLRAFKDAHSLGLHIAYDPFAIEARSWHQASRLFPLGRDGVAVVAKDGSLVLHRHEKVPAEEILAELARMEGVALDASTAVDPAAAPAPPAVQHVGSDKAVELLEKDASYILVDVRTLSEFEADHAPMAIHMPVDELPQRYAELKQTDKLLFVCQAGGRSTAAAEFLSSIGGTEIYNVVGGMSAWSGPRVTGGDAQ